MRSQTQCSNLYSMEARCLNITTDCNNFIATGARLRSRWTIKICSSNTNRRHPSQLMLASSSSIKTRVNNSSPCKQLKLLSLDLIQALNHRIMRMVLTPKWSVINAHQVNIQELMFSRLVVVTVRGLFKVILKSSRPLIKQKECKSQTSALSIQSTWCINNSKFIMAPILPLVSFLKHLHQPWTKDLITGWIIFFSHNIIIILLLCTLLQTMRQLWWCWSLVRQTITPKQTLWSKSKWPHYYLIEHCF